MYSYICIRDVSVDLYIHMHITHMTYDIEIRSYQISHIAYLYILDT